MTTVGNMSLEELKRIIREQINEIVLTPQQQPEPDSSMHRWFQEHRLPYRPGQKSTGELLREDRDR
ncbi:MAG: hypothetical protein JXJ17_08170 [Anaerolineae bacterium]|nr:hypothetical protein [Anaerolineae bacterium]